jgi:hypothetical protein
MKTMNKLHERIFRLHTAVREVDDIYGYLALDYSHLNEEIEVTKMQFLDFTGRTVNVFKLEHDKCAAALEGMETEIKFARGPQFDKFVESYEINKTASVVDSMIKFYKENGRPYEE